jgi:hypothetical protein
MFEGFELSAIDTGESIIRVRHAAAVHRSSCCADIRRHT